jgi:ketose-bisphosphate aldolase
LPLSTVHDILAHAAANRYGVPAFNTINLETVKYAILAAERERMPVIVQFWPGFEGYCPMRLIAAIAKDYAARASVPVAVHLDHSANYGIALRGIRDGFPSVMVDGSLLPFEENIALTASVCRAAEVFGVDVEAELGHVGSGSVLDDFVNADRYTGVSQAAEFAERTGCGSLAVAVGNAHGAYMKAPVLDFARISAIRKRVSVPLVLHGCSDIPDEQLQEAVNLGMSKFNIATEYFRALYAVIGRVMAAGGAAGGTESGEGDGASLLYALEEPMEEFVRGKIRLLNPNHYVLAV